MMTESMALTVNMKPFVATEDEFFELCASNPELRFERNANGEVIIMPPAGSESGARSGEVFGQLWLWNKQTRLGRTFDSSAGFTLPNGAIRAPDAAWIIQQRWDSLSANDRRRFASLCPDLVVEVRSRTDALTVLQSKMEEYIANGAQLGWLIDPENRRVEIYRAGEPVQALDDPQTLSGDPVLPGFVLDLTEIFTEVSSDG